MTESNLIEVDNVTLTKEYNYFKSVCDSIVKKAAHGNDPLRQAYISELEMVFNSSDRKHDGRIDRKEFETLIKGYFELKAISPTQENYDKYFLKLDMDHDSVITMLDFIKFVDQVVLNDILPFIECEMQARHLL